MYYFKTERVSLARRMADMVVHAKRRYIELIIFTLLPPPTGKLRERHIPFFEHCCRKFQCSLSPCFFVAFIARLHLCRCKGRKEVRNKERKKGGGVYTFEGDVPSLIGMTPAVLASCSSVGSVLRGSSPSSGEGRIILGRHSTGFPL